MNVDNKINFSVMVVKSYDLDVFNEMDIDIFLWLYFKSCCK